MQNTTVALLNGSTETLRDPFLSRNRIWVYAALLLFAIALAMADHSDARRPADEVRAAAGTSQGAAAPPQVR